MKKIIFTRSVHVPKVGIFNKDQDYTCDKDYADYLINKGYAVEAVEEKPVASKKDKEQP